MLPVGGLMMRYDDIAVNAIVTDWRLQREVEYVFRRH